MTEKTIYRIVTESELQEAKATGRVPRNASDEASGFIHLSPYSEVLTTAQRYYTDYATLSVLEVSVEDLGPELRWEPVSSRKNVHFPHLYASNIPWAAVCQVHTVKLDNGRFDWLSRKEGL